MFEQIKKRIYKRMGADNEIIYKTDDLKIYINDLEIVGEIKTDLYIYFDMV